MGGVFARRGAVLARPHEKIKGENDKVADGLAGLGRNGILLDHSDEVLYDQEWNWLDSSWGWVRLPVVSELVVETDVNQAVAV
jgi:hypothetical protein